MGDADFASFGWQGSASFEATWQRERNVIPAIWSISVPGDYTITFTGREDGVAVDAFVLQLSALSAPEAEGPAESEMKAFFEYCEANWQDMEQDKAKVDAALELFATAQAKALLSSCWGMM